MPSGKREMSPRAAEQGFGDGEVDAGDRHQQFHAGMTVGVGGDLGGTGFELCFDLGQQAEVAVERFAAVGIELELRRARRGWSWRRDRRRGREEPVVEHGVDAVLEAGAVGDEHGAGGGLAAHGLGFRIGIPDAGQIAGRSSWASTRASTLSVLILAEAMARVRMGLETTTSSTKGASSSTTGQVLVVASTASRCWGERRWRAKFTKASRVAGKRSRQRRFPFSSSTAASTTFLCKSIAANGILVSH